MNHIAPVNRPQTPAPPKPWSTSVDAGKLASWRPEEPPPLPMAALQAVLDDVRHALVPAPFGQTEVEAGRIVAAFGSPSGVKPDAYADALAEALEPLPVDLLALAGKRARTHLCYPPRPAEVVALVAEELALRRLIATRAEYALAKARREPPLPPASRVDPSRFAALRATLGALGDAWEARHAERLR